MKSLDDKIREVATEFSLNETDIRNSATLVGLINSYNGAYVNDGSFNGGEYGNGVITMGGQDYLNIETLAHELGHATGSYQASYPDSYATARDYADARERGEGEAIAIELKVMQKIDSSYIQNYGFPVWKDNAKQSSEEFYTDRVIGILSTPISTLYE